MKITWYSNAPWAPTGYGQQTAEIVPRIKAAGHEVIIANNYGLNGALQPWAEHPEIPIYPAGIEPHSTSLSPAHHLNWGGDWLITLYDVWPLMRDFFPGGAKSQPEQRTVSWVPIDHQPVPPDVLKWCQTVRPIAMSRFGERQLRDQGLEAEYIPHSINTKVFTPTPSEFRKITQIPEDAFLVIINAANKGREPARKAWPEMFAALAFFQRDHKDAYVYVHTDSTLQIGLNLEELARAVGLDLQRVRWADSYALATGLISPSDLARIYTAGDVLLSPSMGEGFGIPVIEAQACGTPVIVSEFSAQPELVGAGWMVKGQPYWDSHPGQGRAFFFTPFIPDIIRALKDAYAAKGDNGLRERAIAKAAQYDTDLIFTRHWRPLLAELEAVLKQPEPTTTRAERRRQELAVRKQVKKAAKRRAA